MSFYDFFLNGFFSSNVLNKNKCWIKPEFHQPRNLSWIIQTFFWGLEGKRKGVEFILSLRDKHGLKLSSPQKINPHPTHPADKLKLLFLGPVLTLLRPWSLLWSTCLNSPSHFQTQIAFCSSLDYNHFPELLAYLFTTLGLWVPWRFLLLCTPRYIAGAQQILTEWSKE